MPMQVDVVSPDEELFSGEATFVLARTVEGDIGILPHHTPLLAELAPRGQGRNRPGGPALPDRGRLHVRRGQQDDHPRRGSPPGL